MRTDNNPSILALCYTEQEKFDLLVQRLKEMGCGVRQVFPVDISIPLDKTDEVLNFIKHFNWCEYMKTRNLTKIIDKIPSMFRPKGFANYTFYDFEKIEDWTCDSQNELTGLQFFPVAYQDHTIHCTNQKEVNAIKQIATFSTTNYEPKLNYKVDANFVKAEEYNDKKI